MEQRDPLWFAKRAGKITGSRFADVMNITKSGPGAARRALVATLAIERLTGECAETYQNGAMARGIELEPEARAAYESHMGVLVEEIAFICHPDLHYVGVSPDGLVCDEGMVELKCPANLAKHLDALLKGEHATEYRWQIQGQMWVAGRQWNDAASFDPRYPEGLRLAIKRVERDEKAITELAEQCAIVNTEANDALAKLRELMGAPMSAAA